MSQEKLIKETNPDVSRNELMQDAYLFLFGKDKYELVREAHGMSEKELQRLLSKVDIDWKASTRVSGEQE